MQSITFTVKNNRDYELLLELAKRLDIDISIPVEEEQDQKQMQGLYNLLDSVDENELFQEIKDPVQWQKELRGEESGYNH